VGDKRGGQGMKKRRECGVHSSEGRGLSMRGSIERFLLENQR